MGNLRFVVGVVAAIAAGMAVAQSGADVVKAKGCLTCHAVDQKKVGPAYKDVAAKYRADKDAPKKLAEKVKKGSQGVWGNVPMPPNTNVPDADVNALVKWILSLK
jgi:cytochrome c